MSRGTPPAGPVAALEVRATVAATFRSVLVDNLRYLPQAALAPFVISVALQLGFALLFGAPGSAQTPASDVASVLFGLLSFIPYVIFGVAWHRLMLLGPERAPPRLMPAWRRRHWRFYGYALTVAVILVLLMSMLSLLLGLVVGLARGGQMPEAGDPGAMLSLALGVAVVLLVVGWLAARLSFLFPAVAVDEEYRIANSWEQTRGQGFRILAAFVLVSIPPFLASLLLVYLFGGPIDLLALQGGEATAAPVNPVAVTLLSAGLIVLGYISMALGVTVLSTAFRACSGWLPDE